MTHRLKVLFVDDFPEFCWDPIACGPRLLPKPLEGLFELAWIQNAAEARWLLEAFESYTAHTAQSTIEAGLPPDILVFDYALSQGGQYARRNDDPTYPIPPMKRLLARHGITPTTDVPEGAGPPPDTVSNGALDRTGCYIGGEFARLFQGYPVGLVPTTARVDTVGTDAAFYEWLNQRYFLDSFKYKSRMQPTWPKLLRLGVHSLRQKILELARADLIRIDINELQQLADQPEGARSHALRMNSKYGERLLPIEGLFADKIMLIEAGDVPFAPSAREWVSLVLSAQFKEQSGDEFHEARKLAEQYWLASRSEASFDRDSLSTLAAMPHRTTEDENTLRQLCTTVGVSYPDVAHHPDKVRVTKPGYFLPHWCNAARNDTVARLAALMLAVRAEQFFQCATEEHRKLDSLLLDEEREVGNFLREHVEGRERPEEVKRLVDTLSLRRIGTGKNETLEAPIRKQAELYEILLTLDPLPENLLFFRHKGRDKQKRRKVDFTYLTHALNRLGHSSGDWGPLGLSLLDVLENRPFNCEICRAAIAKRESPPKHPKTAFKAAHGIRTGEGQLLRIYADELRFPPERWPIWLKRAP